MKRKQPLSRILCLLLLTAATLSALPLSAEEFTIGQLTYTSGENSTVSVSKCDYTVSGELVIPESVVYNGRTYTVTSIGERVFYWYSSLTSVSIPNSVTSIGESAFDHCSGLTSITIPKSVTSIGESAFSWCSSLTSVSIPNSVTSIGEWAFACCSSLTSVSIPSSVTSIRGVFSGCSSLTSVSIPNSVTSIGNSAFSGCSSLTSVSIPNSVTSIGNSAFNGCSSLTSATIPNSVTSIGESAFYGCSSLTSVTIPSSVTSIGEWTFNRCNSLTSVTIPSSVTSIGVAAFYSCRSLTSLTIPNSVTNIGGWAFADCNSLTSVSIPNSVTSIGEWAFADCSSLTSITIPSSVTSIGEWAFADCSSLTDIQVESGNPNYCSVDGALFNSDKSMLVAFPAGKSGEYQIPGSVTEIGNGTFHGCSKLTSVTIPNSVTSIDEYAFNGCENLKNLYLFGKSAEQLPVESVYTFYDNGYNYDNAVYLIGEIMTTQTMAEFDVQKVGEVEYLDFEYTDATGAVVKETANQSGRVSLVNLRADSTTALKITVHMTNGEAYEYNSEVTTKDADDQSAIEVVEIEGAAGFDIYTTSGERVRRNAADLSGLRPGIYIANGRKYIVQ